jgi:hypothetical protein
MMTYAKEKRVLSYAISNEKHAKRKKTCNLPLEAPSEENLGKNF